jgi:hypothetical protein
MLLIGSDPFPDSLRLRVQIIKDSKNTNIKYLNLDMGTQLLNHLLTDKITLSRQNAYHWKQVRLHTWEWDMP